MLKVISSIREFEQVESSWDELAKTGTNWHMLGDFVRNMMLYSESRGQIPIVVLEMINGHAVGICAFVAQRRYGFRVARFLLPAEYSPDFIVAPGHREAFVADSLEVLFERMKCQIAFLSLPGGSPQGVAVNRYCRRKGLKLAREVSSRHSVIMVDQGWKEFEMQQGGEFRRHFRKIEGKLTRSGAWTTVQAKANGAESVKKIEAVETYSWKHQDRRKKKPILAGLRGYITYPNSRSLDHLTPDVFFLELNGAPIAYAIVCKIDGVAYIAKTSYDNRYLHFYPGQYVQHTAIRSLFDAKRVSRIDFMTDLPYHRKWTSLREPREIFRISQSGLVFALCDFFIGKVPYRVLKFNANILRISLEPA
jgi:hypothetical protein